jgi:hypothetical protein
MRTLALLFLSLCLSLPALAERKHSIGNLDIHYSVFNSSFLQPDTAAASGLIRSRGQGVLNIAVLQAGKPSAATVTGKVRNLLGQETTLNFRQIREGEAIYNLAQFPLSSRELLTFSISVQQPDSPAQTFSFNQEVFPDP